MIFAIDFDGTIVEHEFPGIGELKEDAQRVINELYNTRHTIIIWTCRYKKKDMASMRQFLDARGVRYSYVNTNDPSLGFQPVPKVFADVYINDHGWPPFPGWATFRNHAILNGWIDL